jgi:uncharacterized membrane protein (UPF0127 family)
MQHGTSKQYTYARPVAAPVSPVWSGPVVSIPQALVTYKVEVVDTPQTREKGLMFRKELSDDRGMLFVFESESNLSFWMKNTLIPLDILFINANLTIVEVQHMVPCVDDPCASYPSKEPAMYALEIAANESVKNGINIGQSIEIRR